MAIAVKQLGNGQLPSSTGDLYVVPGSKTAVVVSIILVNGTAGALTVNLLAVGRRLVDKDLSIAAGARYAVNERITLEAGDKIRGDAASSASVDYLISGIEVS